MSRLINSIMLCNKIDYFLSKNSNINFFGFKIRICFFPAMRRKYQIDLDVGPDQLSSILLKIIRAEVLGLSIKSFNYSHWFGYMEYN